jgi:hypothetical protein
LALKISAYGDVVAMRLSDFSQTLVFSNNGAIFAPLSVTDKRG